MGDTLNIYGHNFQIKVLAALCTDREFVSRVYDIIEPAYFDNDSLKFLSEKTLLYYKEYKKLPTLEVFKVQTSTIRDNDLLKQEVVANLKETWRLLESSDLDFVKTKTIEFCQNQELKRAILKSVDLLKEGKYDAIKKSIDDALKKGVNTDTGHNYISDVAKRYEDEEQLECIKTGWDIIDDVMFGGLPKTNLGVVMAPTGVGKSWVLCHLGASALKYGKQVLHITLELNEMYVGRRYDAILTKHNLDDLKYHVDDITKVISKYDGKLLIKYFPPGTLSIDGLNGYIERLRMLGFEPDVVIVDYAELLKIPVSRNLRSDELLAEIYKELRGTAGTYNCALWTADQSNRSGVDKDVLEGDMISNSFAKLFAVDFLLTLSRRPKDKVNNTARFHIGKSRLGPDGLTFPARFTTTNGQIEVFNEKTDTGKKVKNEMVTDEEYSRKYLSNMYEQLVKKKQTEDIDIF